MLKRLYPLEGGAPVHQSPQATAVAPRCSHPRGHDHERSHPRPPRPRHPTERPHHQDLCGAKVVRRTRHSEGSHVEERGRVGSTSGEQWPPGPRRVARVPPSCPRDSRGGFPRHAAPHSCCMSGVSRGEKERVRPKVVVPAWTLGAETRGPAVRERGPHSTGARGGSTPSPDG